MVQKYGWLLKCMHLKCYLSLNVALLNDIIILVKIVNKKINIWKQQVLIWYPWASKDNKLWHPGKLETLERIDVKMCDPLMPDNPLSSQHVSIQNKTKYITTNNFAKKNMLLFFYLFFYILFHIWFKTELIFEVLCYGNIQ